ncbi:MAG: hypothetical protein GXP25_09645 [Planctomycetes bacterium]|nr:hypothetical protein [Planctomycetota bacterium]
MKTRSYDPRIKQFLLDYFDRIGAEVEHLSEDLIQVRIPEEHAQPFDGKTEVLLAFRFADMKGHDDAQFITFGSYTLDRVIRDCMARGDLIQRYIETKGAAPDDAALAFPATISGCIVIPGDTRRVYAPYITFTFLVCYNADMKTEEIASVTIDPRTRKPIDDEEMETIRSYPAGPEANEAFASTPDQHEALFVIARKHTESEIADRGEKLRRELDPKLREELERLHEYYRDAIEETQNSRRQNIAEEVRRLEQEREVRIREETDRYGLIVDYRLLAVTCRHYPIVERAYQVSRDGVSIDRGVGYDLLRRKAIPLRCDACERVYDAGALCEHGHLVCVKCIRTCDVCAKQVCADCILGRCHITRKTLCRECGFVCGACGKVAANGHKRTCEIGGETICSGCAATCAACGKLICPEHTGNCRTCEKPFCSDHLRTCHICGGSFCFDHTAACPDCGKVSCLTHRRTCSICRQAYCQSCFDTPDTCRTCSAALKAEAAAPSPEVMELAEAVGVRGEVESFGEWQVGENNRFLILLGESFFGRKVLVIDKESKSLAHTHKVGLIGKLFGRR